MIMIEVDTLTKRYGSTSHSTAPSSRLEQARSSASSETGRRLQVDDHAAMTEAITHNSRTARRTPTGSYWRLRHTVVATHEIAEIAVIANGPRARRRLHRHRAGTHVNAPEPEVVHA